MYINLNVQVLISITIQAAFGRDNFSRDNFSRVICDRSTIFPKHDLLDKPNIYAIQVQYYYFDENESENKASCHPYADQMYELVTVFFFDLLQDLQMDVL